MDSSESDDAEESKSEMASQSPVALERESTNEVAAVIQTHQALVNEFNQIKDAQQSAITILDQDYNPNSTTVYRSPPRL